MFYCKCCTFRVITVTDVLSKVMATLLIATSASPLCTMPITPVPLPLLGLRPHPKYPGPGSLMVNANFKYCYKRFKSKLHTSPVIVNSQSELLRTSKYPSTGVTAIVELS